MGEHARAFRSRRRTEGSVPSAAETEAGATPGDEHFAEAAETFALLATPTRLRLLWLLARGERDVSSLAEAVHATLPAVSQHLAKLRLADLVTARAAGRRQLYRIDDPHVAELVDLAVGHHADPHPAIPPAPDDH